MTTNKNTHKTAKAAHDPEIIRSGADVTIVAPTVSILGDFGSDSSTSNNKDKT